MKKLDWKEENGQLLVSFENRADTYIFDKNKDGTAVLAVSACMEDRCAFNPLLIFGPECTAKSALIDGFASNYPYGKVIKVDALQINYLSDYSNTAMIVIDNLKSIKNNYQSQIKLGEWIIDNLKKDIQFVLVFDEEQSPVYSEIWKLLKYNGEGRAFRVTMESENALIKCGRI